MARSIYTFFCNYLHIQLFICNIRNTYNNCNDSCFSVVFCRSLFVFLSSSHLAIELSVILHLTTPASAITSIVLLLLSTRSTLWLRQTERIRDHLWHRYSVTVNQVMVVTLHQGNHDRNHRLWNNGSTERHLLNFQVLLECCYI